jgi:membrane protein
MSDDKNTDMKAESKSVGKQVWAGVKEKDLTGLAKEIAYDILFATAPLLIFITALTGAVTQVVNSDQANPAAPVLKWMTGRLPTEAAEFLRQPMENALTTDPGFLLSFGALFALWGAKNAMSGVIKGLNTAYNIEADQRSFVRQTLVSIGLTIGIGVLLGAAGLIFVLGTSVGQNIADAIGLGTAFATVSTWLRWPIIAIVVILTVAMIHRYGPNLDADLKWYLPGAAFTVVAMVIATLLLGIYFSMSGGYSAAYGTFGAVLAFVFWLYVMSLLVLVGGVINMAIQKEVPPAHRNVEEEDNPDNRNEDVLENDAGTPRR